MDDLLEYNRKELYKRLNKIETHAGGTRKCDDVFEVLSVSIVRDKRLVNDYNDDEVILLHIDCKGGVRLCRMFTNKGIRRYIHEGKLLDYDNACKYFDEIPRDKEYDRLQKMLEKHRDGDCYKTKPLLKWAYEKRKQDKELGEYISIDGIIKYLEDDECFDDLDKIKLLRKYIDK